MLLPTSGKGLGKRPVGGNADTPISAMGWNILREDVSLPVATLREPALAHNLAWMRDFMARYGVQLAPHGKTTMAPALFQRQLAQGAWGITLATAPQTQVAYQHGVRRVLMANQLVGKANMALIADLLVDPDFRFYCLVDSVANVDALGDYFGQRGQTLHVLIELGVAGGRNGVRNMEDEAAVVTAIARWPALRLAGIEIYEGVLKDETSIRSYLHHAASRLQALAAQGVLRADTAILTGAGSAWFDVVAECWNGLTIGQPLDIVLRPGCYLTHDVGAYAEAQTRMQASNPVAHSMQTGLLPALQVWAHVQSRPEPGLAIVGLGKRDAAYDAGYPLPALHYRPGDTAPHAVPAGWQITRMMDQHAFLQLPADAQLAVGDLLCFEISHPCLTFDKWRQLALIDADYNVIDLIETFF